MKRNKFLVGLLVGVVIEVVITFLSLVNIVPVLYIGYGAFLLGLSTVLYLIFQVIFRDHHIR